MVSCFSYFLEHCLLFTSIPKESGCSEGLLTGYVAGSSLLVIALTLHFV